ncbi:heterokaryon incompatibility protein-domain-containing protein [Plectosphaerella cucumerina]|uniref:Heterokaryon incompatibility protein-domain-containing protein n=1 Tax=Plectosphaerella cucumerina TaxID=40658 RepID=A0A8K0X3H6_9PEZI|nr:heterokaryon incompatibility protein-domain-containing protein [Plectosphaerella cucumerina]
MPDHESDHPAFPRYGVGPAAEGGDRNGSASDLFSQLRAAQVNNCPVHLGCNGSCAGDKPSGARPLLQGAPGCSVRVFPSARRDDPASMLGPISIDDTFETYRYTRLAQGDIRLLKVHKGAFRADGVICEVHVCSLEQAPEYAALSYCWGGPGDERKILLVPDGKVFTASRSLESALRRFRAAPDSAPLYPREEYLWADAICINQDDDSEKSEQLLMMADIYKKAETVYVDLGDEDPDWYAAYSLMAKAANVAEAGWEARDLLPPLDDDVYAKYWKTFLKPWFTRTWIVQEFALARRVMGLFGSGGTFWWYELQLSFSLLLLRFNESGFASLRVSPKTKKTLLKNVANYLSLERLRFQILERRHDSLHCMVSTRALDVTQPKDKVFALLSLFPEDERTIFDDYSKPARHAFIRFAVAQTKRGRALDLLDHAGLSRRPGDCGGIPSWVPDWTFKELVNGPKRFSGRKKRPYSTPSGHPATQGCIRNKCLLLSGFLIDTVIVSVDAAIMHLDLSLPNSYYDRKGLRMPERVMENNYTHCSKAYRDPRRAFAELLLHGDVYGDNIPETNRPAIQDPWETYQEFKAMSSLELKHTDFAQPPGPVARYLRAVREAQDLKFAITSNGFMALVPLVAKEGDEVCIFGGQEVPFLLRRQKGREGFLLVGDAYVHGIMYGEALESKGISPTEIFLG